MKPQRKKGVHKNINNQKERLHYGRRKIPKSELNGLTESQHREIYHDNHKLGVIWALHKYTPKRKLFKNDIVRMIGWKIRDIKNDLQDLLKEPPFNTSIKTIKIKGGKRGSVVYYLDNSAFSELEWDVLKDMYLNIRYRKPVPCLEGNKCEQKLYKVANEVYPKSFIYNGNRLFGKRIGPYTPDILHVSFPIIIEHYGSIYHADLEKNQKRKKYLESQGYHVLIIWDYEDKNKNKIKKQIKDFVENAIQNISRLAI
jgi:very-short-patch-repair endonuclease